jgi:hypothetical protein
MPQVGGKVCILGGIVFLAVLLYVSREPFLFCILEGALHMDSAFMRKSVTLIAKGMTEKKELLQKDPSRYPYSKVLHRGMRMFLAASQWAGFRDVMKYANEASFLSHFITKPIREWFDEWEPEAIDRLKLQEEPFYNYGPFAYQRAGNVYTPSSDCYEFLETQDSDIMDGTDERVLHEKMRNLNQEAYCRVRRYLIEHPIITLEDRRTMSLELADDSAAIKSFQFAYEEIKEIKKAKETIYRCPRCGWTMVHRKYGYSCHSPHCIIPLPVLTDEMKLDTSAGDFYRLKKGVMRYFSAPGKLELEIAAFCEKEKLRWALWPQMDRYDVEVQFPDGEIWEIDAKAYRNPIFLRAKIQNDNGFPEGNYARGYFVVPSEYTTNQQNYTAIINRALKNQKNVKCVTLRALKSEITRKERACHEEQG